MLVVDNGSTDGSQSLAAEAGARVLREDRRGKGYAVATGIAAAAGSIIVLADSDGTYDLEHLDTLVNPVRAGCDMVTGNRLAGQMEAGSMPWLHRHIGNPAFSALIGAIARQRFGDCLSGLRAFKREAWLRMAPQAAGFELESEISARRPPKAAPGGGAGALRRSPGSEQAARAHSRLGDREVHRAGQRRHHLLRTRCLRLALGVVSLIVGVFAAQGVEVGSSRWQPVFAGGILIPSATALMTLGLAAKWLAWRRGISEPGPFLQGVMGRLPAFEMLLFGGIGVLIGGLALDGFLLYRWSTDNPPPLPLGLGAIAQTMVVTGLNLMVAALLLGVLRMAAPQAKSGGD